MSKQEDGERAQEGSVAGEPARPGGKRTPRFSYERCKACGICSHFCPQAALETGQDGYPELADPEVCSSCRLCERMCPDFAIYMASESEEAEGGGQDRRTGSGADDTAEVCHLFDPCEG
jgi:2-oxoglutarate ferredoxin oxidoreductase subunit delta